MIYRKGRTERIVRGQQQRFYGDHLVVGLPHLGLVLHQLDTWGASPRVADEDERLGLALVCLEPSAAVSKVRRQFRSWVNEAVARAEDAGAEAADLDLTLVCLRRLFAQRYAGWLPALGKNRLLERVTGSSVVPVGSSPGDVLPRGRFPGNGARVGVVDSRLRPHPWLDGAVIAAARDLATADGTSDRGDADHATFVTGLVLRQAPGAVVDLRAGLRDDGTADGWSLAKDLADLGARDTDVIQLSVGCRTDDGRPPMVLQEAVRAVGPRTVVVAAAGDHGGPASDGMAPAPVWPAAMERVVAVGALDGEAPADSTPDAPWVDALAPGADVVSTCDVHRDGTGGLGRWGGSAFAAAAVAGAIAARVSDGVDGPTAWRDLAETSKRDHVGRSLVGLRRPSGWPADGRPGRADEY
ncbi:S8 family serine peptidase [Segeticoccus rhizosphaerae]|jgi:hypothetical protein|uniref:S8 family serine peptidase n=1 Tax=Segeticoccus rhizosphaerae TaxID=1104777 RepID=UPI00126490D7|nr:S8 family serine peptidase [Segeticoccus rhizosphaerae]